MDGRTSGSVPWRGFLVWQDAKSTGQKELGEMPVKDTSSQDNGETELHGWNYFEARTAKKATTELKDLSLSFRSPPRRAVPFPPARVGYVWMCAPVTWEVLQNGSCRSDLSTRVLPVSLGTYPLQAAVLSWAHLQYLQFALPWAVFGGTWCFRKALACLHTLLKGGAVVSSTAPQQM